MELYRCNTNCTKAIKDLLEFNRFFISTFTLLELSPTLRTHFVLGIYLNANKLWITSFFC
ncbi:hypothetical protein BpHYR1_003704 [Brachionus plicatilis]|uniref:Uncharacterized protein n=1 Tax=Brachionus plicatilis TaxID=10195 RepID=A0A3M7REU8_BRAPC|nr:hypothetical protein BpHYR1_003704 [Brachionus plicatilis]